MTQNYVVVKRQSKPSKVLNKKPMKFIKNPYVNSSEQSEHFDSIDEKSIKLRSPDYALASEIDSAYFAIPKKNRKKKKKNNSEPQFAEIFFDRSNDDDNDDDADNNDNNTTINTNFSFHKEYFLTDNNNTDPFVELKMADGSLIQFAKKTKAMISANIVASDDRCCNIKFFVKFDGKTYRTKKLSITNMNKSSVRDYLIRCYDNGFTIGVVNPNKSLIVCYLSATILEI